MSKLNTVLCDGTKIVALVDEDDYVELEQADFTNRLVDDFGSVEMVGYGVITFGVVDIKVKAVYIFSKDDMDAVEELDQLTYTVHKFEILDNQD